MNWDAATIERMVREVLSQTRQASAAPSSTAPRPSEPDRSTPSPASRSQSVTGQPTVTKAPSPVFAAPLMSVPSVVSPDNLVTASANPNPPSLPLGQTQGSVQSALPTTVLHEHVITADLLKELVKPGHKVVISRKAIITPSARDYLRNARLTIERATSSSSTTSDAVRWRILVSGVNDHSKRAIEHVCLQHPSVTQQLTGDVKEAVLLAVSAICRAEVAGVVIVAASAEAAACRANRHCDVRAAAVHEINQWPRIQAELQPNVVCLSPHGKTFMELQNTLVKMISGPAPVAPSNW